MKLTELEEEIASMKGNIESMTHVQHLLKVEEAISTGVWGLADHQHAGATDREDAQIMKWYLNEFGLNCQQYYMKS